LNKTKHVKTCAQREIHSVGAICVAAFTAAGGIYVHGLTEAMTFSQGGNDG